MTDLLTISCTGSECEHWTHPRAHVIDMPNGVKADCILIFPSAAVFTLTVYTSHFRLKVTTGIESGFV
jgi:hypothetical protein